MSTQEIMALATDYAQACYNLASPDHYDAERAEEARDALQSAIEAQAAEIERLKRHIKHIGNDALRKENLTLQAQLQTLRYEVDAIPAIKAERDALQARLAAMEAQEPVAWINWNAATGVRSISFDQESELASQPLYYTPITGDDLAEMTDLKEEREQQRDSAVETIQKLVKERDSLRAELGQYPEIQAMLMSENKQLRAENKKLNADMQRQEPVWFYKDFGNREQRFYGPTETHPEGSIPLYAAPKAQEPLTDAKAIKATERFNIHPDTRLGITRAIEAAHGIGGQQP